MAQKYNQAHSIVFERGWSDSSKKLDKRKKKKEEKATSQNPKSYSIEKGEDTDNFNFTFPNFQFNFLRLSFVTSQRFCVHSFFTNIKIEWTQTGGL